jgi:hypothetical protein
MGGGRNSSPEGSKVVFDHKTNERRLLRHESAVETFIYWNINTIIQRKLQDLIIAHILQSEGELPGIIVSEMSENFAGVCKDFPMDI